MHLKQHAGTYLLDGTPEDVYHHLIVSIWHKVSRINDLDGLGLLPSLLLSSSPFDGLLRLLRRTAYPCSAGGLAVCVVKDGLDELPDTSGSIKIHVHVANQTAPLRTKVKTGSAPPSNVAMFIFITGYRR